MNIPRQIAEAVADILLTDGVVPQSALRKSTIALDPQRLDPALLTYLKQPGRRVRFSAAAKQKLRAKDARWLFVWLSVYHRAMDDRIVVDINPSPSEQVVERLADLHFGK